MTADRRRFLAGMAGLCLGAPLTACSSTGEMIAAPDRKPVPSLGGTSVYVPGYMPEKALVNGVKAARNRHFARNISDFRSPYRLLTKVGMDGRVTQALLPAYAHDVKIAPDKSIGILCGFEEREQVAFDPQTLDLVAKAPAAGEGWRGGGHAVFLDRGKTVAMSERAPRRAVTDGRLEAQYGRITIRDADTLAVRESYSSHGIDPHDIRLIDDGRYLVAANYGSLPRPGKVDLPVPRDVPQACVTIIDMANGRLVDRIVTARNSQLETRHLAAGRLDRIFAIQARLGSDADGVAEIAGQSRIAAGEDITTDGGIAYLAAATLKLASGEAPQVMGNAGQRAAMRHGLSIAYDDRFDQAIATFPSSHHVMVFDGASGRVVHDLDSSTTGLRYPCGVTLLPDGKHYAVAGYWENLYVFERGTHKLVRDLCLYPVFFGHSHITAA